MKNDLILRVVAKLLMPYILLFALYVQFHGDSAPAAASRPASSLPPRCCSTASSMACRRCRR